MAPDQPGGGPGDPSGERGLEVLLSENATPEDVLRLVREFEVISARLEALLQARAKRSRRPRRAEGDI